MKADIIKEEAALKYANKKWPYWTKSEQFEMCREDFLAGTKWTEEHKNQQTKELTRTNAQLDEMVTKYNELSKKYADLYTKHYGKLCQ